MITFTSKIILLSLANAYVLHTDELEYLPMGADRSERLLETSEFHHSPLRTYSKKTKHNVCISKTCVKLAALIIENMNETVDPCDNFYEFSCGGYVKSTKLPVGRSSINAFSDLDDVLRERMKEVLAEPISADDTPTTKMTKNLYRSCMNTTQTEKLGIQPLRDIISTMGGWPVVEGDSWNENGEFNWIQKLYKNHELGYSSNILFSFDITPDEKNSSYRLFQLDQPSLGISREYLINGVKDSDVKAYLNYSIGAAILFGADPVTAANEMTDAILFEMELANISKSREERRNFTNLYHILSIEEMGEIVPSVPWPEFLNHFLPSTVHVDSTEQVQVSDPNFFRNFTVLIDKVNDRTLANYIIWRMIKTSAPHLSKEIRQLKYAITEKVFIPPKRWKECVQLVKDKLPIGLGNLYVKNFFNMEAKANIGILVEYLRQSFDGILSSLTWMDDETKARALEKSKGIHSFVGYPDQLLMDDHLEEYFGTLIMDIDQGPQLQNVLRINKHLMNYSSGLLREQVDKSDWKKQASVAVVNAYYYSLENSIKFPAGILQGIFFDQHYPQYVNFAGIGFIIGHEITHAFDDKGRQFDAEGNLRDWWNPETAHKFLEKANCIIQQYSNYTLPENGQKLNGLNSQGEDIADNGGVKEAYVAYQNWARDNEVEPRLPGLTYNINQLFWIALAQKKCSVATSKYLKQQVLTGVHSPNRFRVIGPLSNSEEFANDFNCPVGAKMNPANKCVVW